MAKRTHYQVLEIEAKSDQATVRSAYRRLVLKYHPDRSNHPQAATLFIEVTQAYEVLKDPMRRQAYDLSIAPKVARVAPKPAASPVAADVATLASLYSKGRFKDAEVLANGILLKDSRQALPYAVLGDIARSRGDLKQAAHMFAMATQMEPRNAGYLRKYEELAGMVQLSKSEPLQGGPRFVAAGVGFGLVVCTGAYVALGKEPALWPQLSLLSTWTLGLVVMLFLAGVAVGASLSVGRMIDRFGGTSGPVALGTIAVFSFWAAVTLYVVLGLAQNSFNFSTSRLMAAVAGIVLAMSAAAGISGHIEPSEVLLWGGNLAYLGAVCGWMATDSMRG